MRLAVDEAPLMPHYSRDSLRCGAFHRLVNCITEIVGGVGASPRRRKIISSDIFTCQVRRKECSGSFHSKFTKTVLGKVLGKALYYSVT